VSDPINLAVARAVKATEKEAKRNEEQPTRWCPFCGSMNLQAARYVSDEGELGTFTIECGNCGAAGPPALHLEEAVRAWNKGP